METSIKIDSEYIAATFKPLRAFEVMNVVERFLASLELTALAFYTKCWHIWHKNVKPVEFDYHLYWILSFSEKISYDKVNGARHVKKGRHTTYASTFFQYVWPHFVFLVVLMRHWIGRGLMYLRSCVFHASHKGTCLCFHQVYSHWKNIWFHNYFKNSLNMYEGVMLSTRHNKTSRNL